VQAPAQDFRRSSAALGAASAAAATWHEACVCLCVCVCVSFVHTSKGRKGAATKSQLWPQLHELGAACSWAAQQ